jgi:predicted amidohydrolase YtcJ
MTETLVVGASRLVSGDVGPDPHSHSRALLVRGDRVTFVGTVDEARAVAGPDAEVLDLDGAVITPAFVDAHVHATGTGLLLGGLDLTSCASLAQCLDAVRAFAASSGAPVLWGHGWDETHWPERRPPTREELDDAVGGRPAYLSRIDVHSALVSTPIARLADGQVGYSPDGPLSQQAHHVARGAAKETVTPAQRDAAQRAFLAHAAAHGVGTVHECGGPDLSGVDDLRGLLALSSELGLDVVGYWGELVADAAQAREVLAATGAHGLAGDLFCDGALGSRTAALHEPYADAPGNRGARYLDPERIAAHVVACTEVGVQAGFHVIGDAAVEAIVEGFALAEAAVGLDALAERRHRLEHLEMVDATQAAALARWGVVASVQPLFDAAWGGVDGMYAARLGAERALRMNPFAALAGAGMVLAFGSDTPVTPVDPWAAVRAAVHHHTPGSGIPLADALTAHTTAGHHAAGPGFAAGALAPGEPASFAVWDSDGFGSETSPSCLRTVVRGRTIFTTGGAP